VLKDECGDRYIISRTGGDEFIILLTKTAEAGAEQLVNRIRKKLEKQRIMGIDVSLSFGWDTKQSEDESVWEKMKNAEDSMYQKKILSNSSKRSADIGSILDALHLICPPEEAHSKRVGALSEEIGRAFGLNIDELKELRLAGELHDIGKIAIDKAVLNKEEGLPDAEWELIKDHPETGYRILSTSREYFNIAEYVLAHHERWDGLGYPRGLKGEEILWKARIISVADAYDAMTSSRPYRKAMSLEEAVCEIKRNAGTQFDPEIAQVFIKKVLKKDWDV
jgi:HD-GYP domain-containing protein (c-di-GMP phosphodiesterase class II)